jgi:hypothetical protein
MKAARRMIVLATILAALACEDRMPSLKGPQSTFVAHPMRKDQCRLFEAPYNPGGQPPHVFCEFQDDGRLVADYVVDSRDTVVSTLLARIVAAPDREAQLATEAHVLAGQLGPGLRCRQTAYFQRKGWYVLLHLRAGTDIGNEIESTPWELRRTTGVGQVIDAFKCPRPTIAT